MQVYQYNITVSNDDLDDLNHVNNVRYVQWVQDIAKKHWQERAPYEIQETYFWVMLTHTIEYKSSALLNDIVELKTYISKSGGVTSTRIVEILNKSNNKLLAKSKTTWCLMNHKTMRPARITQEITDLFC